MKASIWNIGVRIRDFKFQGANKYDPIMVMFRPNENKMSDGGRGRAPIGVKVWKSSQKWSVQRFAVRSIAWLDAWGAIILCIRESPPDKWAENER